MSCESPGLIVKNLRRFEALGSLHDQRPLLVGHRGIPSRAGEPLEPDLGREIFRGRDDVARKIERLLADPSRASSIALLAPRRCGKTSMLKMLPVLLPDAVCVFFDLHVSFWTQALRCDRAVL